MTDDHLLPRRTTPSWRDIAACRDTDTAIFFDHTRQDEAFAYCATCPTEARTKCAQAGEREFGIWGGRPERNSLTCRWCGRAFPKKHRGGKQPVMCSDDCRRESERDRKKRYMAKVREENHDDRTECDLCGRECWTRTQWGQHRRFVHGIAGTAQDRNRRRAS